MKSETSSKVLESHLKRTAYLYVRQSTLRQVLENQESTKRQYDLRQRAMALGWPAERILTIDTDLGQSGASAADREGFQRLVTEVSLGRAGIVMGLEVSRLARNSTDWHRLLEICALTDTLILDEDGVYDPAHFNDRLLLGLKGTMSEAELHVIRARLRGGLLNKARRGELEIKLPIGFVYDNEGNVQLDPDERVRGSIQCLFATFRRTGSAVATVKEFREQGLQFPRRAYSGPHRGEVLWGELVHSRLLWILHHPRYAGAFCFGRTRFRKQLDGRYRFERLAQEDWTALIRDAHAGYISWEEFEQNTRRLNENAQAIGADHKSAPREGPALLQGIVVCGVCGARMTIRYQQHQGRTVPWYMCHKDYIERAGRVCQQIHGSAIDAAIGELLVELMTPRTLEVTLAVQRELEQSVEQTDRLRRQEVERARYEADQARHRYMKVDPDNRLVADTLEAEWNAKLRRVTDAQDKYEHYRVTDAAKLDEQHRARVLELTRDFGRLWADPGTADRDRKRMVRLLIEDVTLIRGQNIEAHVRFKGGASRTLSLCRPKSAWMLRQTPSQVVQTIDRLLDDHTDGEIAKQLNQRGLKPGEAKRFHPIIVRRIRKAYDLESRYTRLRKRGLLTLAEMARRLRVSPGTVKIWSRAGLLAAHPYDDRGQRLFELPGRKAPLKYQRKQLAKRLNSTKRNHRSAP